MYVKSCYTYAIPILLCTFLVVYFMIRLKYQDFSENNKLISISFASAPLISASFTWVWLHFDVAKLFMSTAVLLIIISNIMGFYNKTKALALNILGMLTLSMVIMLGGSINIFQIFMIIILIGLSILCERLLIGRYRLSCNLIKSVSLSFPMGLLFFNSHFRIWGFAFISCTFIYLSYLLIRIGSKSNRLKYIFETSTALYYFGLVLLVIFIIKI